MVRNARPGSRETGEWRIVLPGPAMPPPQPRSAARDSRGSVRRGAGGPSGAHPRGHRGATVRGTGCLPRTFAAGVAGAGGKHGLAAEPPAPMLHGSPEGLWSSRLSSRFCPVACAELHVSAEPHGHAWGERGEAAAVAASRAAVRAGNRSILRRDPRGTRVGLGSPLQCGGAGRRRDANENGAGKAAKSNHRCVEVQLEPPGRGRARARTVAGRGGLGLEGEAGRSRPGAAERDSGGRVRSRLS